jgi:hypothetical protein
VKPNLRMPWLVCTGEGFTGELGTVGREPVVPSPR